MAPKGKKVYQISCVTGNVIAEYKTLSDAERQTGVSKSQISKCCHYIFPRAGGFAWCVAENLQKVTEAIKKAKNHRVRLSLPETIEILRKFQSELSYKEISRRTGYTCEELQEIYDRYKIYRCEG